MGIAITQPLGMIFGSSIIVVLWALNKYKVKWASKIIGNRNKETTEANLPRQTITTITQPATAASSAQSLEEKKAIVA